MLKYQVERSRVVKFINILQDSGGDWVAWFYDETDDQSTLERLREALGTEPIKIKGTQV